MKKVSHLILISFAYVCSAQPILQSTNFMPIGFTCDFGVSAPVSPGSSGPNQAWDFSTVSPTPTGTASVVAPGATPCSSAFPTSNWAQTIPGIKYNYYLATSSQIELLGDNIPATCAGGITYSDSKIALVFPFSYNSTFTDRYVASTGSGTVTTTYDGYGTLITPTGTLTNVVRIKIIDGSSTIYQWFTTGNPAYSAVIAKSNNTIFLSNVAVGIEEHSQEIEFKMYPNPAANALKITSSTEIKNLKIFDLLGNEVLNFGTEVNTLQSAQLDISKLNKGIYFIQAQSDGKMYTTKFVKE